jgi:hypothetical protein
MIRSRFCAWPFLLALWAPGVAGAATNEVSEPFEGVRLIHSRSSVPRLVDMWVVEIDMAAPGLAFRTTPSNGALVGDTTPQTTRAFATQIGAQLAVNANFFASAGSGQYDLLGLSVSDGDAYSPFQSGFRDALNVSLNNVATIIRGDTSGFGHTPPTTLYNAVGGNTRLVTAGANVANSDPAIHPRTAAGVTADGKLLLFTVDGRNAGHSEGLTYREMADVLIRWGARDAINLDGGGSTTFVMDNPMSVLNDPRVMNIPVGVGNVPHSERSNGNNFGVFAQRHSAPTPNTFVFTDFEQAEAEPFNAGLAFSGSNRGFDTTLSTAQAIAGEAYDGLWSQRLSVIDDPNLDGDTQNPGGAWFVRHVAGGGNPANNINRPAIGSVGFWAMTTDANLRVSLVVDDASGLTGERGIAQDMIADGAWHPYFWDVNDDSQWEGWVNGDGVIDEHFTLDSIQIFGPPTGGSDQDAELYIDAISHITPGFPPGDYNEDWKVDAADYVLWRKGLNTSYSPGDYQVWSANFGADSIGAASGLQAPSARHQRVPEPVTCALAALGFATIFFPRASRRASVLL